MGAHLENNQIMVLPYEKEIEPRKVEEPRNSNNLYVKFIPESWTEGTLREQFGCFGKINSVKLSRNNFGQYAFICYFDPNSEDKSECFRNAAAAQKSMDQKIVGNYSDE